MRRFLRDNAVELLFFAIVVLAILALGSCTFDSLITINLPPKPEHATATSQPSGSFLDRLLEDLK